MQYFVTKAVSAYELHDNQSIYFYNKKCWNRAIKIPLHSIVRMNKSSKSNKKKCEETKQNKLTIINAPPNTNIITKSELRPRNEPSSSMRQYRYVNIILNRKLNPIVPKNRNVVASLHSWYCRRMSVGLKYNWNGETTSRCCKNKNMEAIFVCPA